MGKEWTAIAPPARRIPHQHAQSHCARGWCITLRATGDCTSAAQHQRRAPREPVMLHGAARQPLDLRVLRRQRRAPRDPALRQTMHRHVRSHHDPPSTAGVTQATTSSPLSQTTDALRKLTLIRWSPRSAQEGRGKWTTNGRMIKSRDRGAHTRAQWRRAMGDYGAP